MTVEGCECDACQETRQAAKVEDASETYAYQLDQPQLDSFAEDAEARNAGGRSE